MLEEARSYRALNDVEREFVDASIKAMETGRHYGWHTLSAACDCETQASPTNYYRVNTSAGALYRAGRYSEALAELERSRNLFVNSVTARIAALRDDSFLLPHSEPRQGRAFDWAFLAMANFQMKKPASAEWWLGKLKQSIEGASIGTELTADRQLWNRMEFEVQYRGPNPSVPAFREIP